MDKIIFPISNSFVINELKESTNDSAGDAKAFLKTVRTQEEEASFDDFFNNFASENTYYFEKSNLLDYLKIVKLEYYAYKEKYTAINPEYYEKLLSKVNSEQNEITFTVEKFMAQGKRLYLRLARDNYIRTIGLPILTKVTITKPASNRFLFTLDVDWDNISSRKNEFETSRYEEFIGYLYPGKITSERNAKRYANRLISKDFKKIASEIGFTGNTEIYCIKDSKILASVIEEIKKSPNYQTYNLTQTSGELNSALEHYLKFYKELTNNTPKNLISYGAPGTGKSYSINKLVKQYYPNFEDDSDEDSNFVFRTTLHKEYMYSDFVGQILPRVNGNEVTYEFIPGIFTLALEKALKTSDQNVFLLLEELSRADVAAVFGDLFQLLDRNKEGASEYQISNPNISKYLNRENTTLSDAEIANKKISIPANLHLYCTVNTTDQNVFVMDTAFKRRFEWQYVSTAPVVDEGTGEELNNPNLVIDGNEITWWDFYTKLNEYITGVLNLSEDKQIGQFFIQFTDNDTRNKELIKNKLLQYLWEDVAKVTYTSEKLFDKKITSFSQLYQQFELGEKVFSEGFFEPVIISTAEEVSENGTNSDEA
ncbi:TPA: AAA family ATPase [Streptococcus suis]